MPADNNRFNVDKDVFQGQLVPIEDMTGKSVEVEIPEGGTGGDGDDKEGTPEAEVDEVNEAREEEASAEGGSNEVE